MAGSKIGNDVCTLSFRFGLFPRNRRCWFAALGKRFRNGFQSQFDSDVALSAQHALLWYEPRRAENDSVFLATRCEFKRECGRNPINRDG